MRVGLTASAFLVSAGLTTAQTVTYDELPAGYTQTVTQIYDYFIVPQGTTALPAHLQYAYDTNDIPVPVANITELAWHRNNYWGNSMPAGTVTMSLTLALSPNTPANMSTTFATNLVNFVTNVYTGTVNWPNVPKGTGPAPYTHNVMLGTPYLYIKGTNLSFIVDVVQTATSYISSTYTIAAAAPDQGLRYENGGPVSTCKFSNGQYNSGLGYSLAGLTLNGGTWFVNYSGILPNAPGAITISGYGMDRMGPYTLPIDLTSLNMPGCRWFVGFDGPWIPLTANASGTAALPMLNVPPGLGGNWFYDQGVFVDPLANGMGLVATWTSKWYIGTLKGPSANTIYRTQDTASNPTGLRRMGYGTDLRITR